MINSFIVTIKNQLKQLYIVLSNNNQCYCLQSCSDNPDIWMIIKTLPFGQGVEEGGFPVVRAEVLQLFGKTLFQALNQGLEEHQALLTAREKTGHLPLICGHYVFVFFKCVLSVYDSFFHHTTLRSQQEDECKKELHDCDDVRVKCLTGSIWWRCSHSRFSCCRGS